MIEPTQETADKRTGRPRRRTFLALTAMLSLGIAAAGGLWAATGRAFARPWGHVWAQEDRTAFARFAAERMLNKIDATEDQRQAVMAIVDRAMAELAPLRAQHLEARLALRDLLTAEAVDRDALERLRQEQISAVDVSSEVLTRSVADVAEILTPEQRQQLAEMRHHRFQRWE